MGVPEILCSLWLVLEGITGKEIPESSRLEFSEKFLANSFALSDAEDNIFGSLNRGGIVDLPLLRTLLAIPQMPWEPSFWEVSFSSICKFGSFKNPFATITSLSELHFRLRRFMLLVQTKKVISMNYGGSTSSWIPWRWVRLDLIFTMRDIYISSDLNTLKNSLAAEALSLKISPHGTSLKWSWNHPNQHENSHKLCNEMGHPALSLLECQWKLRQ